MNIIIRTAEVSYGTTEVRVRRVALDGKEHEVSAPGASRKESTQWECETLIIRSRQTAAGRVVTVTERWKLVADGGMEIDRHVVGEGIFQVDERLVLKKAPTPN
jgi:hypothetical protein